ncbi:hypothetical protein C0J52_05237 [Blattella germanica]|nr:hypothetical protein C0J52_05237 [Blattella germanica]
MRKRITEVLHKARSSPQAENLLNAYAEERRQYKKTVKQAKENYQLMERSLIEYAEMDPSKALKPMFPKVIPMETWMNHLGGLLQGFHKHKSTLQAIPYLKDNILESLQPPKDKLFMVFIDYTKVFEKLNRQLLTEKVAS